MYLSARCLTALVAPPPGPVSWWPSWSSSAPLLTGASPFGGFLRLCFFLCLCFFFLCLCFLPAAWCFFLSGFGRSYFGAGSSSQWLAACDCSSPRLTR